MYVVGDWVNGLHGLCMRFTDSTGTSFSGRLMPRDTAGEPMQVVKMLMSNAGFRGAVTPVMVKKALFMRFVTALTSMPFEEYRQIAKGRKQKKEEVVLRRQAEMQRRLEAGEEKRRKTAERRARREARKEKIERTRGEATGDREKLEGGKVVVGEDKIRFGLVAPMGKGEEKEVKIPS